MHDKDSIQELIRFFGRGGRQADDWGRLAGRLPANWLVFSAACVGPAHVPIPLATQARRPPASANEKVLANGNRYIPEKCAAPSLPPTPPERAHSR